MVRFIIRSLFSITLVGFAASNVLAQAQVNLSIVESSCPDGQEMASATWSSDPNAVITVTRDTNAPGEVWLIDLTASGHQVPGGGITVLTWEEPEHPGLFNNLYIVDPQHLRLESEAPVATGDNIGSYPGGFGNGVSFYAGDDFNGDLVFPQITEVALDETDPLCVDPLAAIEAKLDDLSLPPDPSQTLADLADAVAALEAKLDTAATERAALEAKLDSIEGTLGETAPALSNALGAIETKLDNPLSQRQQAPGQLGDTRKP